MGRPKEPTNLLLYKNKKHLTKQEIDERMSKEVHAPADAVDAPKYLLKRQKTEFKEIAEQLIEIGIMSNLDCDALARFIIAKDDYVKYVKKSRARDLKLEDEEAYSRLKDKAFRQARAAASDLGLTIGSRCKLTIPTRPEKPEDKNEPSDFDRDFGDL